VKPVIAAAASTAASDEDLIVAAREGSDEAFEALFRRYRDRITSYVRGFVRDEGRAEDLLQETFISALRSLRESEREIAFKPWIYQIARNASIDYLRRQKTRAGEVSLDAGDFKPHDEGRLAARTPTAHTAAFQREELETLSQAFGGLPRAQHEALVLRELEGLSYAEIGSRMGLTPSAVESTIFRARRGLRDEFEEIATGERCRTMQIAISALAEGIGTARDRRMLERHVRHCVGCRSEAAASGLADVVEAARHDGRFRRAFRGAAALFPFPFFERRTGDSHASLLDRLALRAHNAAASAGFGGTPAVEQAAGLLPKAVAVVVAAALIGGGGLIGRHSGSVAAAQLPQATTAAPAGTLGNGGGRSDGSAGVATGPARAPAFGSIGSFSSSVPGNPLGLGGALRAGTLAGSAPGALGGVPGSGLTTLGATGAPISSYGTLGGSTLSVGSAVSGVIDNVTSQAGSSLSDVGGAGGAGSGSQLPLVGSKVKGTVKKLPSTHSLPQAPNGSTPQAPSTTPTSPSTSVPATGTSLEQTGQGATQDTQNLLQGSGLGN
jgi:RNA polymerase sigma factor (sigma-70 family)